LSLANTAGVVARFWAQNEDSDRADVGLRFASDDELSALSKREALKRVAG
jgi:hypothetical protein